MISVFILIFIISVTPMYIRNITSYKNISQYFKTPNNNTDCIHYLIIKENISFTLYPASSSRRSLELRLSVLHYPPEFSRHYVLSVCSAVYAV